MIERSPQLPPVDVDAGPLRAARPAIPPPLIPGQRRPDHDTIPDSPQHAPAPAPLPEYLTSVPEAETSLAACGPITEETVLLTPVKQDSYQPNDGKSAGTVESATPKRRPRRLVQAAGALVLALTAGSVAGSGDVIGSLLPEKHEKAVVQQAHNARPKLMIDAKAKQIKVTVEGKEATVPADITKDPNVLIAYASSPDVNVQQIASIIVDAHHIDPLTTAGDMPIKQYVTNMVDDLESKALTKDFSAEQLAKIKTQLAYAYTLVNYPTLAQKLTTAEDEALGLASNEPGETAQDNAAALQNAFNGLGSGQGKYEDAVRKEITLLLALAQTNIAFQSLKLNASPETSQNPDAYYAPTVEDVQQLFPGVSKAQISKQLPVLLDALHRHELDKDPKILAYLFATISVENSAFDSRLDEINVSPSARYRPYIGRGLTQLTWDYNYLKYGNKIGKDLLRHPELMHDMHVDSEVFAKFQRDHLTPGLRKAIMNGQLRAARAGYNGGANGIDKLGRVFNQAAKLFSKRLVDPKQFPIKTLALNNNVSVPAGWERPKLADECDPVDEQGYTKPLRGVADALQARWGTLAIGGVIPPNDKKYGHGRTSEHYNGHALDVMLNPRKDPENFKKQEDIANWLVQHAAELNIRYIIVGNRIWNIEKADEGWRVYHQEYATVDNKTDYILAHYDHIHISVYESSQDGQSPMRMDGVYKYLEEQGASCHA